MNSSPSYGPTISQPSSNASSCPRDDAELPPTELAIPVHICNEAKDACDLASRGAIAIYLTSRIGSRQRDGIIIAQDEETLKIFVEEICRVRVRRIEKYGRSAFGCSARGKLLRRAWGFVNQKPVATKRADL